jgi:hypothetical protein
MATRNMWLTAGIVSLLVISGSALAYTSWRASETMHARLVASTLVPSAALLADNEVIIRNISKRLEVTHDAQILESYLALIRRDGLAKHADIKQQLDVLAENNAAIAALAGVYVTERDDAVMRAENEKFKRYAIAWRDRWNSVMELFMAGGNFPPAGVPMPMSMGQAVRAELDARLE